MKLKLLLLVLALQTAWILGTTFVQERTLAGGKVVLLETRPVDPRDLLRGDYVILNYKISDVALDLPPAPTNGLPRARRSMLRWSRAASSTKSCWLRPTRSRPPRARSCSKGHSRSWWNSAAQNTVHLEYGLERYYVREGTGNPRGKITVQAAVPDSGQAQIKEVFVDGKPYAEAMQGVAR